MENKFEFGFYDLKKFNSFLDSLSAKDAAKLANRIDSIQKRGIPESQRMKWVKKLDNNLYEIRSKFSSNIQRAIYFHYQNNEYVITHGFTKKSQKTPKKEIVKGKNIRNSYLKNKQGRKR